MGQPPFPHWEDRGAAEVNLVRGYQGGQGRLPFEKRLRGWATGVLMSLPTGVTVIL